MLWSAWPALDALQVFALSMINQLVFFLRAMPVLMLLAWPLAGLPWRRLRLLSVAAVWSMFLLGQAALEVYFRQAGVPLGADLFGYDSAEIRTTVSGVHIGINGWIGLLVPPLVLCGRLIWRTREIGPRKPFRAFLPALVLIFAWLLPWQMGAATQPDQAKRTLVISKGAAFVADIWRWWRATSGGNDEAVGGAVPAATMVGLDPNYPFWHEEATPDALGAYFKPTHDGRPPNVVMIVVEGLGRSFSGPDAELGSFTPFLDALASRSLYFSNFMANQGRTFGVLPALLGSLPQAKEGFTELGAQMPAAPDLFNVLVRQGYSTSFYMGTDGKFDNEAAFLRLQGVGSIIDLRHFGSGYQRNPFSEWGYPDHELVSRVLADSMLLQPPFVLGVQTISMHTNYQFPGQSAYKAQFEARLRALQVPQTKLDAYRKYADIYSAILYTDAQLQRYFQSVEHAPWFADTIFVITGDHRLVELPLESHVSRYHVPLMIYSPLLTHAARIRGISSHMDVTPSLLALLSHRYGLQRPAKVTWVGRGLDLSVDFNAQREFPLKQTKTSVPDFVSGRWLLHDDQVFELHDELEATEADDAQLKEQLLQRRQAYLNANAVFLKTKTLSPEGGMPQLVTFDAGTKNAEKAVVVAQQSQPGVSVEAVTVARSPAGVTAQATFVNGDAVDSRVFVPMAVLTDASGQELAEAYGAALQLHVRQRQSVRLELKLPQLGVGRYYISVLPTDPESGKRIGHGRYHTQIDVPEASSKESAP